MQMINDWLPWVGVIVFAIAGAISSYYHYAKKADPTMAEKIKHVGVLADWAVANQSRFTDKAGINKFKDAVADVMMKAPEGTDKNTAEGAVQYAYMKNKQGGNKDA
ncbi:hypothetical protein [Lactobacillus sp. PV034]|uniref:hypothetical protein n=1 Tax=Lactobacillus sp. PV034 TaxID=2594495 RepID=UPI0022401DFA|nr:hypothetical protein [Lactobacillus sp. PV034]QNQ80770.1 DUF92 domain-containing protein [Lactobacillus sp. PV034]